MNQKYKATQEDRVVKQFSVTKDDSVIAFGVLDGHGGSSSVTFIMENLPAIMTKLYAEHKSDMNKYFTEAFKQANETLRNQHFENQGACACIALLRDEEFISTQQQEQQQQLSSSQVRQTKRMLYVANIGDTRAVLSVGKTAVRMSKDHKASDEDEQQRIKGAGGIIFRGRLDGVLGVTRAFGDFEFEDSVKFGNN